MKNIRWPTIAVIFVAFMLVCLLFSPYFSYMIGANPSNIEVELQKNREKWNKADITHYKMVIDSSGYVIYDQMPWTIEVQNNKIISATNAQNKPVENNDSASTFTITALFADIKDRIRSGAPSIQVSYHPLYGYPEHISITPYREPCCQGYEIDIRDFQILP